MIPTLLGAVTLIFLIMRLLPGDVALYILGSDESSQMNQEALQRIRSELGLDKPLIVLRERFMVQKIDATDVPIICFPKVSTMFSMENSTLKMISGAHSPAGGDLSAS